MPPRIFEFADFTLDCDRFELSRAGRSLKLERKPLELLILLASRRGSLVTRTEIAECLWDPGVFVDTDHGINTVIRKIRHALRDDPARPRFVQTVSGKGYRFVSPIAVPPAAVPNNALTLPVNGYYAALIAPPEEPAAPPLALAPPARARRWLSPLLAILALAVALAAYFSLHPRPRALEYTQLTDLADSAVNPVLSPDGHLLAFFRGTNTFFNTGAIDIKILPSGEIRRVTDDPRLKYSLAFSPDGSRLAYTVLEDLQFNTYLVPTFGGEPRLLLNNAAGLTWLDNRQLLFSRWHTPIHLGIVTGALTYPQSRDLYFPPHERAMAHYSFASPDRKSALVVAMDENGDWAPCVFISLDQPAAPRSIGPQAPCLSAAWSPDGRWMFFNSLVNGRRHIWRQAYASGDLAQLTFGPTEEEGVAVEPDGRSLITSLGVQESAIWYHDGRSDRPLTSEGEVIDAGSPPRFSSDEAFLYFLMRLQQTGPEPELWRIHVASGKLEQLFPGVAMTAYDLSPTEKNVLYLSPSGNRRNELWLAPLDRRLPPRRLPVAAAAFPAFGPHETALFLHTEGSSNYLGQISLDGSHLSSAIPFPVFDALTVSPQRRWFAADALHPRTHQPAALLIPLAGGDTRTLCAFVCGGPTWSPDGKWLYVTLRAASPTDPGRTLAIPLGPNETLPPLPATGINSTDGPDLVPGAQWVERQSFIPGNIPTRFAYVNTTVHRNLYRVKLP